MSPPTPHPPNAQPLFRLSLIGDLLVQELHPGELTEELKRRAALRYRPPGATATRLYHWKTLQRWLLAARDGAGRLEPVSRKTGFARSLSPEQRELLLAMRRDHPSAAVEVLLSEAVRNGVIAPAQVSVSTLSRLFRDQGLDRQSLRRADRGDVQRRRWQAARPGDLWHADVCHLVLAHPDGRPRRVYVHGFLDDHSRMFPALVARSSEQETDMLEVFSGALLKFPAPKALYLDNGACYRGEVLARFCKRLGIVLLHATPHNPEARGKMERVWRTMRQRCTDHLEAGADLQRVNTALWAWLDADYHRTAHSALLGRTPQQVFRAGLSAMGAPLRPRQLAEALETTVSRTVRRDCTFSLEGELYEVVGAHLAQKRVEVTLDGLTGKPLRVRFQEQSVRFGPCDPQANRERERGVVGGAPPASTPFDPITALLAAAREVNDE